MHILSGAQSEGGEGDDKVRNPSARSNDNGPVYLSPIL